VSSDAAAVDRLLAVELLAVDPTGLGGVVVRGAPSLAGDENVSLLRELLGGAATFRLPLHITDDRLFGGLSLAATLHGSRPVYDRGLLAQAHRGVLAVASAERLRRGVVAALCEVLDRRVISVEREGQSASHPCEIALVAFDEGLGDERIDDALADRLAFLVRADGTRSTGAPAPRTSLVAVARARLHGVLVDDESIAALCAGAMSLGITSLRAPILALRAARANAALAGRLAVAPDDLAVAARLVLAPRAKRAPVEAGPDHEGSEAPTDPQPTPHESRPSDDSDDAPAMSADALAEVIVEAAKSGMVAGTLDSILLGKTRARVGSIGRAGEERTVTTGGRPAGTVAAVPRDGQRLAVVDTLRAAAPWQTLRKRGPGRSVVVAKQDLRVFRCKQRVESTVVFCVDASGSTALQRLAETKGAIELLLADCYVRRDHVALVAFRGEGARVVLPPTRSLARVRRCLGELVGGGATPLAAGIAAAQTVAIEARRQGKSPLVVLLTDGRANVARSGEVGSRDGSDDSTRAAGELARANVPALLFDTSARPRPAARELAVAMAARYVPLPYADSARIADGVRDAVERGR
jgi:magnesium chelatase subunit D